MLFSKKAYALETEDYGRNIRDCINFNIQLGISRIRTVLFSNKVYTLENEVVVLELRYA